MSRNLLSLAFLDNSDENRSLVSELGTLERAVNDARKIKRRLEIKIEGLEHDLMCAEKARELGSQAALGIARRLAALFGEALRDEDIVARIQQLQERAQRGAEEVAELRSELFSLRASQSVGDRDLKEKVNELRDEMTNAHEEEERLSREISRVESEIYAKESAIQAERASLAALKQGLNFAIRDDRWNVSDITGRLSKNTEQYLLEQFGRIAESVGVNFDPRMQAAEFVEDVSDNFQRLAFAPHNDTFPETAADSKAAIDVLNALNGEISTLAREQQGLREELALIPPAQAMDLQSALDAETREQKRRAAPLQTALLRAVDQYGCQTDVPANPLDVCAAYTRLLSAVQSEAIALQSERPPRVDMGAVLARIGAVRRQNRRVRSHLKIL
jgi:ribosomal protein L29